MPGGHWHLGLMEVFLWYLSQFMLAESWGTVGGNEPPHSGRVGGKCGKLGSPPRGFPVRPREQQVPPVQGSLDLPWSKHQDEGNHRGGALLRLVQLKLRHPRGGG